MMKRELSLPTDTNSQLFTLQGPQARIDELISELVKANNKLSGHCSEKDSWANELQDAALLSGRKSTQHCPSQGGFLAHPIRSRGKGPAVLGLPQFPQRKAFPKTDKGGSGAAIGMPAHMQRVTAATSQAAAPIADAEVQPVAFSDPVSDLQPEQATVSARQGNFCANETRPRMGLPPLPRRIKRKENAPAPVADRPVALSDAGSDSRTSHESCLSCNALPGQRSSSYVLRERNAPAVAAGLGAVGGVGNSALPGSLSSEKGCNQAGVHDLPSARPSVIGPYAKGSAAEGTVPSSTAAAAAAPAAHRPSARTMKRLKRAQQAIKEGELENCPPSQQTSACGTAARDRRTAPAPLSCSMQPLAAVREGSAASGADHEAEEGGLRKSKRVCRPSQKLLDEVQTAAPSLRKKEESRRRNCTQPNIGCRDAQSKRHRGGSYASDSEAADAARLLFQLKQDLAQKRAPAPRPYVSSDQRAATVPVAQTNPNGIQSDTEAQQQRLTRVSKVHVPSSDNPRAAMLLRVAELQGESSSGSGPGHQSTTAGAVAAGTVNESQASEAAAAVTTSAGHAAELAVVTDQPTEHTTQPGCDQQHTAAGVFGGIMITTRRLVEKQLTR
ncbi:hypothetical protein WJX73_002652 [Symbiochloris irregularis]|uniref:Uncharacterized protein n=1 Tax=Symbiochloris irregularis TaxID=706552 RepID=A0AAW1NHE2_9CHLO